MKMFNKILLILICGGMFCWSGLSAQTSDQKTPKATTKGAVKTFGDGSVHKVSKPAKKRKSIKEVTDGTSNTLAPSESTSKKKKSKGIKDIKDGTSNTIMLGEQQPTIKKDLKPVKWSTPAKQKSIRSQPAKTVKPK